MNSYECSQADLTLQTVSYLCLADSAAVSGSSRLMMVRYLTPPLSTHPYMNTHTHIHTDHHGKKMTEDHYFMRSKTLHRDEDMTLELLRSRLVYYHSSLLSHFKSSDPEQTGCVTSSDFTVSQPAVGSLILFQ